ncbi:MAG: NAD(+) synthase [Lachnospiraceae bacterium]|jgi:NAD+ synthase
MRNYKIELENRVAWIRELLREAHCSGIIFGNSGGKDSALAGIICKMACDDTVGIIMPCASNRNYGEDTVDANAVAKQFSIETRTVDLTGVRQMLLNELAGPSCCAADCGDVSSRSDYSHTVTDTAAKNIAPRLRMTTLYAIGQSEGRLVAGTGNRDELYVGYYTKYGDGGADFNPIGDLTVGEVYEFLAYLDAPMNIRTKAPSAGLEDGQTDEKETGILYADLDEYLLTGYTNPEARAKIEKMHAATEHKRTGVKIYGV